MHEPRARRNLDAWGYCPGCGFEVTAAFQACPSCGAPVEVPGERFATESGETPEEVPEAPAEPDRPPLSSSEDLADRALRAAIFGFAVPLVLPIYSFWLLLRFVCAPDPAGVVSYLKATTALLLDLFFLSLPFLLVRFAVAN